MEAAEKGAAKAQSAAKEADRGARMAGLVNSIKAFRTRFAKDSELSLHRYM